VIIATVKSLSRFPVKSMAGEHASSVIVTPQGLAGDRVYALRDERQREIRGAKHWPQLLHCSATTAGGVVHVELPSGRGFDLAANDAGGRHAELDRALSELVGTEVTLQPLRPASDLDHYRRRVPGARLAGTLARSRLAARGLQRLMAAARIDGELRAAFGRESGEALPDLSAFPAELFEFVSPPGTYFDAFPIHLLTTATLDALAKKQPALSWNARRFRPNFLLETVPELAGFVELSWAGRELAIGDAVFRCTVATPRCSMVMQAQAELPQEPLVLRTIVRETAHLAGMYASVVRPGTVRVGDAVALRPAAATS
jgi:uncharacterized protein